MAYLTYGVHNKQIAQYAVQLILSMILIAPTTVIGFCIAIFIHDIVFYCISRRD